MQRIFYGVQLFMILPVLLLITLRFPEFKTCETAAELRRVVASPITYRSDLNLSACLFYNIVSKQICNQLIMALKVLMFNKPHFSDRN
jgi:hypothetical protein